MIAAIVIGVIFFGLICSLAWPLGGYIAIVMESPNASFVTKPFRWIERGLSFVLGGIYEREMGWKEYFFSICSFFGVGIVFLFCLLHWQAMWFYFDPSVQNMPVDSAFTTAISYVTNTNWLSCIPEIEVYWIVQMIGMTVQQFFSAAVGIVVLCAFSRGLKNEQDHFLGNFWRDFVRTIVYVLVPLSLVVASLLVCVGVPQSVEGKKSYTTLEGVQTEIVIGMYASQVAIKQLGTNGGGIFRANSAHPFENPSPLSNLIELFAIFLIPIALCRTFSDIIGSRKQGIFLISVMAFLFFCALIFACLFESKALSFLPDQARSFFEAEGNMEGKECRFGPFWSIFWTVATTCTSHGSVNCALSSLLPMAGAVPMVMMQLGVFGGVGTGVVGAVIFLLLAVFFAGLMVGRTPEYLGKKIESAEMKLLIFLVIFPAFLVLLSTVFALLQVDGRAALSSLSPHGITEVIYAFSSAATNNGSSFAGLAANVPLYNYLLAAVMLSARVGFIALVLLLADRFGKKKRVASSLGTLPTETVFFGMWYCFVIVIIGALNFLPACVFGPVLEHVMLFYPIQW